MANEADGTISKIEPGQTSRPREAIGSVPQGMAGVGGDLWVSVRGRRPRIVEGHCDCLENFPPESLDPRVPTSQLRGWCCICSGTDSWRPSRSAAPTAGSFPTSPPRYRLPPTAVERTPSSCARGSDTRTARSSSRSTSAGRSSEASVWNAYAHATSSAGSSGARPARTSLARVTSPKGSDR